MKVILIAYKDELYAIDPWDHLYTALTIGNVS